MSIQINGLIGSRSLKLKYEKIKGDFMRVVILGVSGLIGHTLFKELSNEFETFGILHKTKKFYNNHPLFNGYNVIENIDVLEREKFFGVLAAIDADVILNCVGITKRKAEINDLISSININSLFPHELAMFANKYGKRVIHFSTDCVFNGKTGNYSEESNTTAEDVYGKTKALGEIRYNNSLTIRSSFIGREMFSKTELLEWFLAQNGKSIKGFTKAMYTGVSTKYLSKVILKIIKDYKELSGLRNLSIINPISKYELLSLANKFFNLNIDIIPDDSFVINPTLNSSKLRKEINITIPSWEEMMYELTIQ